MFQLIYKTQNKKEADEQQILACEKYSPADVYRFQYQSNDGNFYYEILRRIEDEEDR